MVERENLNNTLFERELEPGAGVTFALISPNREVLMQQRDDGKGKLIQYPKYWCIPGGSHDEEDSSDSPIELAVREIKEEVGLSADQQRLEPLTLFRREKDGGMDFVFVYPLVDEEYQYLKGRLALQDFGEGMAWQFMGLSQIKALELAFEQDKVIPDLERRLNPDIN
jgi:8-oxo-dGTP pyrophosphatase MutT (NUDIX family)